jgi:hypothetical protein
VDVIGDDQADSQLPSGIPIDSGIALSGAMAAAHDVIGHQTACNRAHNEP